VTKPSKKGEIVPSGDYTGTKDQSLSLKQIRKYKKETGEYSHLFFAALAVLFCAPEGYVNTGNKR
jgi:hypothetical protein